MNYEASKIDAGTILHCAGLFVYHPCSNGGQSYPRIIQRVEYLKADGGALSKRCDGPEVIRGCDDAQL